MIVVLQVSWGDRAAIEIRTVFGVTGIEGPGGEN
jgi:hypothetical protein